MRKLPSVKLGRSFAVRFSKASGLIVSCGLKVHCWLDDGRKKSASAHPFAHPANLDISQEGRCAAVKNTSGQIALLSLPTLTPFGHPGWAETDEGCQVFFSPCSQYLVDGSWQGDLVVRHIASGNIHFSERAENAMTTWLAHSGDRRSWVYVLQPKAVGEAPPGACSVVVRTWPFDASSAETLSGPWRYVQAAALSPEADRVAVLHDVDGVNLGIDVLDRVTKHISSSKTFQFGGTNPSIAWSPNGRLLACVQKSQVAVFDAATLEILSVHEAPYPCFVEFSPAGDRLAIGSWEQGMIVPVGNALQ